MSARKAGGKQSAPSYARRNTQWWLSLLEEAHKLEWPPTIKGQKWRVFLTFSSTVRNHDSQKVLRTSPVFPADKGFRPPDLTRGVHYICFFCFDPAFPVLGRLIRRAPKRLREGLLYSTGLASIILLTRESRDFRIVEDVVESKARSKEMWRVENGRIVSFTCGCLPSPPLTNVPEVFPYESLPLVPRTTVDEFVANIGLLLPKIQLHIPSEVSTFVQLIELVNELVAEMVYVLNPKGRIPGTLAEYSSEQFGGSPSLRNRILHQNTDRVVQINAAMSYISTQALSGAVPILDRRSLIRRYSLLGVGTATLALTRIAHRIDQAFAKGALEDVLNDRGSDAAPLPGLDMLPDYDASQWREFSSDSWSAEVRPRPRYPKLPYFSGRLGFREAEYTVTAALQAIAAGAGPGWSLLTLTHEMLHGHVRNLLAMLFQGDPNRRPDHKWQEFYDRFAGHCRGNPSTRERLLDSLRTIVLFYCCRTMTHGSLTREIPAKHSQSDDEFELGFPLLTNDNLWLAYEMEYRNISEIFVHVLDLHYFYFSSVSNYIPLVWRSWSQVPQVWGDLRQYMLRSLLVVASKTDGSPYERFAVLGQG